MLLYRYNCPRLIYKNSFWFQFQGHIVSTVVQISIPLLEIIKNLFLCKKHINHITKSNACVNIKHLKRDMSDSQWCPWNINLLIMGRTTWFPWFEKCFILIISSLFLKQRTQKWKQLSRVKVWMTNSYFIRQSFKGTIVNRTCHSINRGS